jgi:hypothetical protein
MASVAFFLLGFIAFPVLGFTWFLFAPVQVPLFYK